MKFDEIKIYHVAMPLIDPWVTSYGSDYEIHSILINVKSDNYSAWSETCALELPTYSYQAVCFATIMSFSLSVFGNLPKIVIYRNRLVRNENHYSAVFNRRGL